MNAVDQRNYISIVARIFRENQSDETFVEQIQGSLFNEAKNADEIENFASDLLVDFRNLNPCTNQKRYKFVKLSSRDELLKIMFDRSFQKAPDQVIAAAERLEKRSFYPQWKRVFWIQIPKIPASIMRNVLFKVAITVATLFISYIVGKRTYHTTKFFVSARAVPFIINHASIKIIRMVNSLLKAKDWIYAHIYLTLFYYWFTRQVIILGPEIPYVTRIAKSINPIDIYNFLRSSPQTITKFLFYSSIDAGIFVWSVCDDASSSFEGVAQKTENERLAISKEKAYEVWTRVIEETSPILREK